MNQDQVKGAAEKLAGKTQAKAGEIVGSEEQQAKGLGHEVKGAAREAFGDVKQGATDLAHKAGQALDKAADKLSGKTDGHK